MLLKYIRIGRTYWENSNLHVCLSPSGWLEEEEVGLGRRMLLSRGKGRGTATFLPGGKEGRSRCHRRSPCGPLSSHPQQTPAEKSRTFWEQRMHRAAHELIARVMGTYGGFNHI